MKYGYVLWAIVMLSGWAGSGGAEVLQDPMRPTGVTQSKVGHAAKTAPNTLHSIVIGSEQRWVLIDGKQVFLGDRVAGGYVQAICHDRVILHVQGKRKEMLLYPDVRLKLDVAQDCNTLSNLDEKR